MGTTVALSDLVRDIMMPTDNEMMRELERSELRRLEPQAPQAVARIRIRRITVIKPIR